MTEGDERGSKTRRGDYPGGSEKYISLFLAELVPQEDILQGNRLYKKLLLEKPALSVLEGPQVEFVGGTGFLNLVFLEDSSDR